MENAVDALKIAFAVFVIVLAITTTFTVVSQAKSTADYVLYYADKTNFYENLESKEKNRTVSVAEVISSLNRYINDSISVTVILDVLDGVEYIFDSGRETVVNSDGVISSERKLLSSQKEKEQNLHNFISGNLLGNKLDRNAKFTEEFTEAPISGIYDHGENGEEIILGSGAKKVYITYTLK